MLAGRMKLQNFVLAGVVVAVAAIGGGYWACKSSDATKDDAPAPAKPAPEAAKAPVAPPVTPTPPVPSTPAKSPAESGTDDIGKRAYDDEVLAWRTKSIAGDHLKDVTKGKPYKLDLYKDAPATTVTRAKLDLNRNGKWDEKYSFKGDAITLQRAPADDDKYTETYRWTGTGWVKSK
jgi:hypothetical protein